MNKPFECKNGCYKSQYLEGVIIGCDKCLKHLMPLLTKEQLKKITEIILTSPEKERE